MSEHLQKFGRASSSPCVQDVYAEDLVHRSPGDASTLTAIESAFQPLTQAWVAAEVDADAVEEGIGNSFTRVTIGQLKPTILRQIADEAAMQQLRRDLSHLYHYYLHGPQGSRSPGQTGSQPRDGSLPEIIIQSINGGRTAWKFNLADVTDDLESQYLQVLRNCCISPIPACPSSICLCHAFSTAGLCCRSVLRKCKGKAI